MQARPGVNAQAGSSGRGQYAISMFKGFKITELWILLSLLECVSRATAMARGSILHPSINLGFSETLAWIQVKFYGKILIRRISKPYSFFFSFLKIFNFRFLLHDPMGAKMSKLYYSPSFQAI